MKKIIFVCILILSVFVSCQKEIDFENIFNNKFILHEQENVTTTLDQSDLIEFVKKSAQIGSDIIFDNFEIIKDEGEMAENLYYLKSTSEDKTIKVAMLLEKTDGGLLITGKTCTCTSKDCNFGCDASFHNGECRCSHCWEECIKTSTITDPSVPTD